MSKRYVTIDPPKNAPAGHPVKAWVRGVPLDPKAKDQLLRTSQLPFIHRWVAAMPDVHWGLGATIGSVIPTKKAIIPAAVGVDIGCGMAAMHTSLTASDLPDNLAPLRSAIEKAVPHGRSHRGGRGDRGAFGNVPKRNVKAWEGLREGYARIVAKYPKLDRNNPPASQLGTLGSGNHFIEICLDEEEDVWFMLHSGSRGVGNRTGMHFIQLAQKDMGRHLQKLPDKDLAYFEEGSEHFDDYWFAVDWAQRYAATNRDLMMAAVTEAVRDTKLVPAFRAKEQVVNCHHNYVARERHYGDDVLVTRKGAVRAGLGDLGIIPGSMGARSFIVRGKGNPESFESCSHGAGRVMSRTAAKKTFTLDDHAKATQGVECRKDAGVIDETPAAYKDIDAVMEAQSDLVEIVHRLKQIVCVKG
ncbi:MAG: RtcB family protein [Acidobacteria bacterium]|nr:MAG: RtcB family protein [Acidobacteriota bacterium]